MNRQEKQAAVERLHESFRGASHAILVDFRGLNVAQTTRLRLQVRDHSARYEVVKNRLALRAARETGLQGLADMFRGPTAVVSGSGDPVPLVRLLRDFSKDHPALVIKGGMVDGQVLVSDRLARVANLPGREELIAKLAGALVAPLSRFCMALKSPLRDLVVVLKEISKKRA